MPMRPATPGDVPEEVLSNRITARRRAGMKAPRGGVVSGGGMWDPAGGFDLEGAGLSFEVRAGPGAIDSFYIAALVGFWSIAGPGGGWVDQFCASFFWQEWISLW